MRKERIRELADHIHLSTFQPKAFANEAPAGGPLVSIYVPIKRTEREDRRDEWDRIEFKDLCEEAFRRLEEHYPSLTTRTSPCGWMPLKAWLSSSPMRMPMSST